MSFSADEFPKIAPRAIGRPLNAAELLRLHAVRSQCDGVSVVVDEWQTGDGTALAALVYVIDGDEVAEPLTGHEAVDADDWRIGVPFPLDRVVLRGLTSFIDVARVGVELGAPVERTHGGGSKIDFDAGLLARATRVLASRRLAERIPSSALIPVSSVDVTPQRAIPGASHGRESSGRTPTPRRGSRRVATTRGGDSGDPDLPDADPAPTRRRCSTSRTRARDRSPGRGPQVATLGRVGRPSGRPALTVPTLERTAP